MRSLALVLLVGCTLSGLKNQCETQADCLDGYTCTVGVCEKTVEPVCTPIACDGHCGTIDDHCDGTLTCGACPDHCANDAKDPSETDVDCGGDCSPCAPGLHCAQTTDCTTGTCDAGTCRTGTWSTVAPMPTARAELAAVSVGGKIYAIGGMVGGSASNVVEVYDPAANSWTTRAPLGTPRYGLAAVVGSDDRIYAIGGNYTSVSNPGASIVAEVYDPTANTWTALPSLPVGRSELAAAAVGDKIYAIGGYDGTTAHFLGSVAVWQVGGSSWTTLADPMTTSRSDHAVTAMPDGRIYALGGLHDFSSDELAAVEYTQPGTPGWNTLAPMPTARKNLAAVPIGALLYAISGNRYLIANQSYTRVVEVYDTATPGWSQVTSIPSGRYGHAAVALGGKIYVLGGRREAEGATTAAVDVFTP